MFVLLGFMGGTIFVKLLLDSGWKILLTIRLLSFLFMYLCWRIAMIISQIFMLTCKCSFFFSRFVSY